MTWEIDRRRAVPPARPAPRPREALEARLVASVPDGHWETMVGSYSDLVTRLMAGSKRREFGPIGKIQPMGGRTFQVRVWRIRAPRPRWTKPAIIAGSVLATLAAIAGLGVWLFSMTTDALTGRGDAVLAGLALVALGGLAWVFRRPVVEVIVKVK
jgi:hypothetical protein